MIKTNVLLFAGLRERLQKSDMALLLPDGTKAGEVLGILLGDLKEAKRISKCILLAVNQTYVDPQTELKNGDELALIPPVAGG